MYIPPAINILKLGLRYPEYFKELVKRKISFSRRYRWAQKYPQKDGEVPPPLMYKLYLTLRCDLHCKMCMFWGNEGVLNDRSKNDSPQVELDIAVLEKILEQRGKLRPWFILSGGEPLLHSKFRQISELLKKHRSFSYLCTNGMQIDKYLDVAGSNPYLIYYISLDGPREINDRLRGPGVYDRVISNIQAMKKLRRKPYVGVQFTLQPENVAYLYETCRQMVRLGVDWILINLEWFITPRQAEDYEAVLSKEYGITPHSHKGFIMPYGVDKDEFIKQCRMIRKAKWPIQVSSYLRNPEDIRTYVDDRQNNPYNNFCYKEWVRMDVMPDGRVTPCIQYPDIFFGSLKDSSVMDIWNSDDFASFRSRIRKRLLPVCSSCYCLYLYDAGRKTL